ncbi:hypothetical protein ACYSNV_11765 [Myroides sp. LJL119]
MSKQIKNFQSLLHTSIYGDMFKQGKQELSNKDLLFLILGLSLREIKLLEVSGKLDLVSN